MARRLRRYPGDLPPGVLIGGVLLLVGVTLGAVVLTRPTPGEGSSGSGASRFGRTSHELNDRDAIAVFKRLDSLRIESYERADPALLAGVFTAGSPAYENARREVDRLKQDGVRSRSTFDTRSIEVVSNKPDAIHLRQDVVITPSFLDRSGSDVAGHAAQEHRIVDWVLVWTGDEWLIGDGRVTELGEP